ncbi:MAG: adenylate/guanylate cyclase domain-containing protein [Candidatus Electryonea clarkiae]|nr:adenylate/guanylate cyclase domain-containing protein [Candidatus Electryonea clarkiae]MDP8286334.1 adenylate/guanylate cyclase domain-containing protein [Candidatus Electryonea clarkiae]
MTEPGSPKRKLAAIMFTDIKGFTAIMAKDEAKALNLIQKNRDILKPIIHDFDGEWLKEMGDGSISSYPSAVEAVYCAIKIQQELRENPVEGLHLRIGIHVGDVLVEAGDVFGDGVNVASRIEPLAPTDGISISERVYDDIRNKPDIEAVCLGSKDFKNVGRPITVYTLIGKGLPSPEDFDISEEDAKMEAPSGRPSKAKAKKTKSPLPVIISAAAAVIIVIVAGFLYLNSQKDKEPAVAEKGAGTEQVADATEEAKDLFGVVKIVAKVSGGKVMWNNEEIGTTQKGQSLEIPDVPAGKRHRVAIRSPEGYRDSEFTVRLNASKLKETITYNPKKLAANPGFLLVSSNVDDAEILVDGESTGRRTSKSNPVEVRVDPGKFNVEVKHSAFDTPVALSGIECSEGERKDINAEFVLDKIKPAMIKVVSSIAGVIVRVNNEKLKGPKIEANKPAVFEYEMNKMQVVDVMINVSDPKLSYTPKTETVTLQSGMEYEISYINPSKSSFGLEVLLRPIQLAAGQTMKFFIDGTEETSTGYSSGAKTIAIAGVSPKSTRFSLKFNSGDYEFTKAYDYAFKPGQTKKLIEADDFNVVRVESNREGAEVFERQGTGRFVLIGKAPIEFPASSKYFDVGVKAPGQNMISRAVNTKLRSHKFDFLKAEAETVWKNAEKLFFGALSAGITPVDATQKLNEADLQYREVLNHEPDFISAKLKVAMTLVQLIEIEVQNDQVVPDNIFKQRHDKASGFLLQVTENSGDPLDRALATYTLARIEFFSAERLSGAAQIAKFRETIGLVDGAVDEFEQMGTLPEGYYLLFDGAHAYKAMVYQRLFEETKDNSFKELAIKAWKVHEFHEVPNPRNPLKPFPNPYEKIMKTSLRKLR